MKRERAGGKEEGRTRIRLNMQLLIMIKGATSCAPPPTIPPGSCQLLHLLPTTGKEHLLAILTGKGVEINKYNPPIVVYHVSQSPCPPPKVKSVMNCGPGWGGGRSS